MWSKLTGKSDSSSPKDDRDKRRESTRRSKASESVVSSSSSRRPSGRDQDREPRASSRRSHTAPESVASSYATYATAQDGMRPNADLYSDPRDEDYARRRRDEDRDDHSSYSRRDRSRDRESRREDKKKDKDKDKDKDKREKRKSRSEAGNSRPQEIVDGPRRETRSVSGQIETGGFSPFPGRTGPPLMSGALPAGTMSSHVPDQFPGQNPSQYAAPYMPGIGHTDSFGGISHTDSFGEGMSFLYRSRLCPLTPA